MPEHGGYTVVGWTCPLPKRRIRDGDEGGGEGGAGASGEVTPRLLLPVAVLGGSASAMGAALQSGHVGTAARS